MAEIKAFFLKYKSLISYAFFGFCTTVVNVLSYYLCYNIAGIQNVTSTVIAWVLAVLFAFIANKLWVFSSNSFEKKVLIKEVPAFFGCRFVTGVLDIAIMYFSVDVMASNGTVWKVISNVLVIAINYVASKRIIFKKLND